MRSNQSQRVQDEISSRLAALLPTFEYFMFKTRIFHESSTHLVLSCRAMPIEPFIRACDAPIASRARERIDCIVAKRAAAHEREREDQRRMRQQTQRQRGEVQRGSVPTFTLELTYSFVSPQEETHLTPGGPPRAAALYIARCRYSRMRWKGHIPGRLFIAHLRRHLIPRSQYTARNKDCVCASASPAPPPPLYPVIECNCRRRV